jgi:hypothetical protein
VEICPGPNRSRIAALLILALALFGLGSTHTVDAGQTPTANVIVNTTDGGSAVDGKCSLAEAITTLNNNSGSGYTVDGCSAIKTGAVAVDSISFNIGPFVPLIPIQGTLLPAITSPLNIDGAAGPGGSSAIEVNGLGGNFAAGYYGFTVLADHVTLRHLVVEAFRDDAIFVSANNFHLSASKVGVEPFGHTPVGSQGYGVRIQGARAVIGGATSGGDCTGDCNLIAGNVKGQVLLDVGSSDGVVKGNFIGPDLEGDDPMGEMTAPGIEDAGLANTIGGVNGTTPGGPCTGDCNLISGGNSVGILLRGSESYSSIVGNMIGLDATGTQANANLDGIDLQQNSDSNIGDGSAAGRNVISGNNGDGIANFTQGLYVRGNYIGTNSAGTGDLGNLTGIGVYNGTARIGDTPGTGNVIAGNRDGIVLYGANVSSTLILGNRIGVGADDSLLGNDQYGIVASNGAHLVAIGGTAPGAGNVIMHNGLAGVRILDASTQVEVRGNSIDNNGGPGIVLEAGGNGNQPAPQLGATEYVAPAGGDPARTRITGTAHGAASSQVVVDFYDSPACDSSGAGEGRDYVGSAIVPTNNAGDASFDALFDALPAGHVVTAIADEPNSHNTSAFSSCATVAGPATPTPTPKPSHTATATPSSTPTATPTGTPVETLTQGDVDCDGDVDEEDFLFVLGYVAGVNDGKTPGTCPDVGGAAPAGVVSNKWGDFNCDNHVTAYDALQLIAWPDIEIPHSNCKDIGQAI